MLRSEANDGCRQSRMSKFQRNFRRFQLRSIAGVRGSVHTARMSDFSVQLLAFDTESTGVDVNTDRVVQLGAAYFESRAVVDKRQMLVNPGVPIPPDAAKVHGITDDKVKDKPPFAQVAAKFIEHLEGRVRPGGPPWLLGYNAISYDTPLLNAEFARIGSTFRIDPARVLDPHVTVGWHLRALRSRKLTDVAAHFGITFDGAAHSAAADAVVSGQLLLALVQKGLVPDDPDAALAEQARQRARIAEEWNEFMYWLYRDRSSGALMVGSGKHTGTPLDLAEKSYLRWALDKIPDLPARVREEFGKRA